MDWNAIVVPRSIGPARPIATNAARRRNFAAKRIAPAIDHGGMRRAVSAIRASVTARDRKVRAGISAAHVFIAMAAHVRLWRALARPSFGEHGPGPDIAAAFALAVLISSAAGSTAAIAAGRTAWSTRRMATWDAVTFAA